MCICTSAPLVSVLCPGWAEKRPLEKHLLALAYIYIPAEGSEAPPGSYSSKDGRDVERLSAVR